MRALILTNQFYHFAGSEMVALEFAEELRRRGWSVHLCANEIKGPLRDALLKCDVTPADDLAQLDLFSFDLVFSQHHLLPIIFLKAMSYTVAPVSWPFLVFSHLSPYDPAEVPGPFIERHFADLVLANSPETAEKLKEYGSPFDQSDIFANPAPLQFAGPSAEPASHLKSLLVVSNHRNRELGKALRIVAKGGVRVTRVGRKQTPIRVDAKLLRDHDAVLTIGKTAQYALRSKRPVFCYDRFAGPGWLNSENIEMAAWFNFSGRDTQTPRTSHELASEIINGYQGARRFALGFDQQKLRPYSLERRMDDILTLVRSTRENPSWHMDRIKLFLDPAIQIMIRHEARLAELYRKEFLHRRTLDVKVTRLKNVFRPFRKMSEWLKYLWKL